MATAILRWLGDAGIDTALIDPGKPWQNATDESFNGKFRDEFLSPAGNRRDVKRTLRFDVGDLGDTTPAEPLSYLITFFPTRQVMSPISISVESWIL